MYRERERKGERAGSSVHKGIKVGGSPSLEGSRQEPMRLDSLWGKVKGQRRDMPTNNMGEGRDLGKQA